MTTAARLAAIADELRALAGNGLHYATNEYDRDRYTRLRRLAAETLALAGGGDVETIGEVFAGDLGVRTPVAAADGAVFDATGRLLLTRRSDGGLWCMPGGAADVGESPSQAARRETREETGLETRAVRLLGLYDNLRLHRDSGFAYPAPAVQTYNSVFELEVVAGEPVVTHETTAVDWFTEEEARRLPLYQGHVVKVVDVFAVHAGRKTAPIVH